MESADFADFDDFANSAGFGYFCDYFDFVDLSSESSKYYSVRSYCLSFHGFQLVSQRDSTQSLTARI